MYARELGPDAGEPCRSGSSVLHHVLPDAASASLRFRNNTVLHWRMVLPNGHHAVIEPGKVRDYLLSATHSIGRFKAVVLFSMGYETDHWQVLRDDLLTLGRMGTAIPGQQSKFGRKFEVDGMLVGPSGRALPFRTIWILRAGEESPRFVTAFPR